MSDENISGMVDEFRAHWEWTDADGVLHKEPFLFPDYEGKLEEYVRTNIAPDFERTLDFSRAEFEAFRNNPAYRFIVENKLIFPGYARSAYDSLTQTDLTTLYGYHKLDHDVASEFGPGNMTFAPLFSPSRKSPPPRLNVLYFPTRASQFAHIIALFDNDKLQVGQKITLKTNRVIVDDATFFLGVKNKTDVDLYVVSKKTLRPQDIGANIGLDGLCLCVLADWRYVLRGAHYDFYNRGQTPGYSEATKVLVRTRPTISSFFDEAYWLGLFWSLFTKSVFSEQDFINAVTNSPLFEIVPEDAYRQDMRYENARVSGTWPTFAGFAGIGEKQYWGVYGAPEPLLKAGYTQEEVEANEQYMPPQSNSVLGCSGTNRVANNFARIYSSTKGDFNAMAYSFFVSGAPLLCLLDLALMSEGVTLYSGDGTLIDICPELQDISSETEVHADEETYTPFYEKFTGLRKICQRQYKRTNNLSCFFPHVVLFPLRERKFFNRFIGDAIEVDHEAEVVNEYIHYESSKNNLINNSLPDYAPRFFAPMYWNCFLKGQVRTFNPVAPEDVEDENEDDNLFQDDEGNFWEGVIVNGTWKKEPDGWFFYPDGSDEPISHLPSSSPGASPEGQDTTDTGSRVDAFPVIMDSAPFINLADGLTGAFRQTTEAYTGWYLPRIRPYSIIKEFSLLEQSAEYDVRSGGSSEEYDKELDIPGHNATRLARCVAARIETLMHAVSERIFYFGTRQNGSILKIEEESFQEASLKNATPGTTLFIVPLGNCYFFKDYIGLDEERPITSVIKDFTLRAIPVTGPLSPVSVKCELNKTEDSFVYQEIQNVVAVDEDNEAVVPEGGQKIFIGQLMVGVECENGNVVGTYKRFYILTRPSHPVKYISQVKLNLDKKDVITSISPDGADPTINVTQIHRVDRVQTFVIPEELQDWDYGHTFVENSEDEEEQS